MPMPDENKIYTYADYLTLPKKKRFEIINGIPYMQAAPTWQHQAISIELSRQFANYLQGRPCMAFTAPFDLRIPFQNEKDEETTFVVQPDIVVVCDKNRLKGTGYYGIPTLIIDITSLSSLKIDKVLKFNKYEKAGVKEYWIIEPVNKYVEVFTLQDNYRYGRPETYTETDKINVSVFDGLSIDLNLVFRHV